MAGPSAAVHQCPTIAPAHAGDAVDPNFPAGLDIAHSLGHQAKIKCTLRGQWGAAPGSWPVDRTGIGIPPVVVCCIDPWNPSDQSEPNTATNDSYYAATDVEAMTYCGRNGSVTFPIALDVTGWTYRALAGSIRKVGVLVR